MARITSPLLLERSTSPEWKGKPIFDECLCYKIKPEGKATPENLLCYAESCIGALSNSQDKLCRHMNILPTPPALEVHLKKFSMMGDIMHVCMKEETEEDFYKCIDLEASKKVAKLKPPKPVKPVKEEPVRKEAGITRKKPPIPVKEEEPERKPEVRVIGHPKFEKGKLITPAKPKKKK